MEDPSPAAAATSEGEKGKEDAAAEVESSSVNPISLSKSSRSALTLDDAASWATFDKDAEAAGLSHPGITLSRCCTRIGE